MRAFLLVVALSVCGYSFAESLPLSPAPCNNSQKEQTKFNNCKKTTKDLRGTAESPFVVNVLPPQNADLETASKNRQEDEKATNDRIIAYATVALAVVTLFLAIFTWRLWNSTSELVKGADKTAEMQLRAYVCFAGAEITGAGTETAQGVVLIKNCGKTPARNVTVSATASALNTLDKIVFNPTPAGPNSSRLDIAPDVSGSRNIPLNTIIGDQGKFAAFMSGSRVLYIYGEILYTDVFAKDRKTKFRLKIGGDAGWPINNSMTVCPEGNEAD